MTLSLIAAACAGAGSVFAAQWAMGRVRPWLAYRRKLALARLRRARWRDSQPRRMTPALRAIVDEECARGRVQLEELIGPHKRRCKRVTAVRWAVLGRAWRELRPAKPHVYTLAAISAALHVDHSSASYALNKMGEKGDSSLSSAPSGASGGASAPARSRACGPAGREGERPPAASARNRQPGRAGGR